MKWGTCLRNGTQQCVHMILINKKVEYRCDMLARIVTLQEMSELSKERPMESMTDNNGTQQETS